LKKFVEYGKLSKKKRHEVDLKRRRLWSDYGRLSPVSKIVPDKRKESSKKMCRSAVVLSDDM
jgi:hypothetical protein